MERKSPYSRRYTTIETGVGIVVVPVVDDLPDEMLQWHYDLGMDNDDFEYAQAVYIEADRRRVFIKT